VPVVCFRRVRVGSRTKGNVQFQGFGIITKVERVTQYDRRAEALFSNYAFDFAIFSLSEENEEFSWDWIPARRDGTRSSDECLRLAPQSWQIWVKEGSGVVERCRRRVVKLLTYTMFVLVDKWSKAQHAVCSRHRLAYSIRFVDRELGPE